mmetsp:Transcript_3242/g.10738  ORF Transcript_3242/g.10738 Transcript_3242/m.10738 type:complete len:170 (+) Transcript_3242:1242-1751(+)
MTPPPAITTFFFVFSAIAPRPETRRANHTITTHQPTGLFLSIHHFLRDRVLGERAPSTRQHHHRRVRRIFEERDLGQAFAAAGRELAPRDEIAFVLGSPRRWPPPIAAHLPTRTGGLGQPRQTRALPEAVQEDLWVAFLATWGRWSALSWPHLADRDEQIDWDRPPGDE